MRSGRAWALQFGHGGTVDPVAIRPGPNTHNFVAFGVSQAGYLCQGQTGAALPGSALGHGARGAHVPENEGQIIGFLRV